MEGLRRDARRPGRPVASAHRAVRVFLAIGGPANLGISATGSLVDLLVSACLCWLLVRIPVWMARSVFSGRGHSQTAHIVRDVVVYKAVRAIAAGAGL